MDNNNSSNVILFRPRKPPEISPAYCNMDHVSLPMLYDLMKYVANKLGLEQYTVRAMVVPAFGVCSLEQLQERDYNRAATGLVDFLEDHSSIH